MLATIDELIDHMSGPTLSGAQRRTAERILRGLQHDLEVYLHRPVEIREFVEQVVVDDDGFGQLAESPIREVTSVIRNDDGTAASYQTVPGGFTTWPYSGPFTVTYRAGLEGHKLGMKIALLEVATRAMSNRHDDTLNVSGFNMRPTEQTEPNHWTDDELDRFHRYKHRTVVG